MDEVDEMVQCSQVDRSTGFIGQHRGVAMERTCWCLVFWGIFTPLLVSRLECDLGEDFTSSLVYFGARRMGLSVFWCRMYSGVVFCRHQATGTVDE